MSLHDAWWRLATGAPSGAVTDRLLGGLLQGGAFLYRLGVDLRNRAYDRGWIRQSRLPCPVVSVGNLTVGGTGKTACVELLAAKIQRLGKRVAILSRGYGAPAPHPYWLLAREHEVLVNGHATTSLDGLADEPQLLARHLEGVPILIGPRRERTGQHACEQFQTEVILLDDGLQYRRLHRDCEVVLVNARMPLGGWPLLPRGPMREPLTALRRAHVVILTKADQSLETLAALQERLRALNPDAVLATAIHEPLALWDANTHAPLPLTRLEQSRVSLLSSIGDPEGFEQTVKRMGASVLAHATYPDHHRYQRVEWQAILQRALAARAEALVTTEKDCVRLQPFVRMRGGATLPVWVLRIHMRLLSGETQLDDRLARLSPR